MLVGASAVQIGTANFINPQIMDDIADGLYEYLNAHNLKHINELVGQMKL